PEQAHGVPAGAQGHGLLLAGPQLRLDLSATAGARGRGVHGRLAQVLLVRLLAGDVLRLLALLRLLLLAGLLTRPRVLGLRLGLLAAEACGQRGNRRDDGGQHPPGAAAGTRGAAAPLPPRPPLLRGGIRAAHAPSGRPVGADSGLPDRLAGAATGGGEDAPGPPLASPRYPASRPAGGAGRALRGGRHAPTSGSGLGRGLADLATSSGDAGLRAPPRAAPATLAAGGGLGADARAGGTDTAPGRGGPTAQQPAQASHTAAPPQAAEQTTALRPGPAPTAGPAEAERPKRRGGGPPAGRSTATPGGLPPAAAAAGLGLAVLTAAAVPHVRRGRAAGDYPAAHQASHPGGLVERPGGDHSAGQPARDQVAERQAAPPFGRGLSGALAGLDRLVGLGGTRGGGSASRGLVGLVRLV